MNDEGPAPAAHRHTMFKHHSSRRSLCLLVGLILSNGQAFAQVPSATFFGGEGDDEVRSVAIGADGRIVLGGTTTSSALGGETGSALEPGDGFVAVLSPDASSVVSVLRLEDVKELVLDEEERLFVRTTRHVGLLDLTTETWLWQSEDLGDTVDFSVGGGWLGVLGSEVTLFDLTSMAAVWSKSVGRDHPAAVLVDPGRGFVLVSGDTNTNTGQEPYRSPFLHVLDGVSGERVQALYDFPGPAVREGGLMLQADSFITFLERGMDGSVWLAGGSDGGNTVLAHEPADLTEGQDALAGACFDGPCFGYQGAKKTGMFGRLTDDFADLDRASWIIPYLGFPAGEHHDPPCGCKGGDGVNPGSFQVTGLASIPDGVMVLGNPWGVASVTADAWYRDATYPGGGIGWVGMFDESLTELRFGTMLPGTKGAVGSFRGGRAVIAGRAVQNDEPTDPAQAGWLSNLPTDAQALQPTFAGGESDGYVVVACLTTAEECAAPPGRSEPPVFGGGGSGAGSGGFSSGGGDDLDGAGGGSDFGSGSDAGCGCRTAAPHGPGRGLTMTVALALGLSLLRARRAAGQKSA